MSTTTLDSVTNSLAHLSTNEVPSTSSKKSSGKERDKSPKHKEKQKEKEKSKHKSKHENGESKSDGTAARKESPKKTKKNDAADEDPAKKKENQSTNKHNEMNGHNNNNMNSIINTDPRLAKPAASEYEVPNFVNTEPIEKFYQIGREIGRLVIYIPYSLLRVISPRVSKLHPKNLW